MVNPFRRLDLVYRLKVGVGGVSEFVRVWTDGAELPMHRPLTLLLSGKAKLRPSDRRRDR